MSTRVFPQTWLRSARDFAKTRFRRSPSNQFSAKKKFSPRFFGLGNHFWSFWAGFGSSSQKWTSSSTSSQFFALDEPIMSSVGPKLGENISVCALWTRHIVLFGKETLSSVDRTHCLLWTEDIVYFEQNRTHCLLWTEHTVLFQKNTLSSLARTHCPLWKERIVFFGKNTLNIWTFRYFKNFCTWRRYLEIKNFWHKSS